VAVSFWRDLANSSAVAMNILEEHGYKLTANGYKHWLLPTIDFKVFDPEVEAADLNVACFQFIDDLIKVARKHADPKLPKCSFKVLLASLLLNPNVQELALACWGNNYVNRDC